MRTILIHLGDNDFHSTFRNLLETVWNVLLYRGEENLTKEQITQIILKGIEFHYFAFQNRFDKIDADNYNYIITYLHPMDILFDEEAEAFIEKRGGDSGSWYLEVQTGKVYYT